MDATQEQRHSQDGDNGAFDESGHVDQIRNILFGSQMRDYDARFQRLEAQLGAAMAELRNDVQKRLDGFEGYVKGELESLGNRLKAEQAERSHSDERVAHDVADLARGLEMKIGHLDEQNAKELRDLREQLLQRANGLSAEISEKHESMKTALNHEAQEIRGAMTGRESLAEMLSEIALRLKNEFRVPGA